MNGRLHKLLLKSFDTELLLHEKTELENALANSEDLRKAQQELSNLRSALNVKSDRSFAAGFEERVMYRISGLNENNLTSGLMTLFRPIAIAAVVLIIVVATFNMTSSEQFSVQGLFAVTEVAPEDAFNPLVDLVQE